MLVQFNRNIQFSRLIKVEGRLREFNFRKLGALGSDLFSVDFGDDRGNRIMFQMEKSNGVWKVMTVGLPDWLVASEPALHEAIEIELKEFFPEN